MGTKRTKRGRDEVGSPRWVLGLAQQGDRQANQQRPLWVASGVPVGHWMGALRGALKEDTEEETNEGDFLSWAP
jgi:hypothetical protein